MAVVPAVTADPPVSGPANNCEPVWIDVNNNVHIEPECLPAPLNGSP
jgi:hypothetical protein